MAELMRMGGVLLLAFLVGCAAPSPEGVSIERWADQVAPAATTPTRLTLAVQPAARAGYRTQFVRVFDWETAEATLTHPDSSISALTRTAPALVEADATRRASLAFAPVRPASGYSLTVELKRRDADGTWRTVASGTNSGIVIAPGINAVTVGLTPTSSGELAVSVPQPSLVAPTASVSPTPEPEPGPVISSFSPTSGSVGMRVSVSGADFSAIPADNRVSFGGTDTTAVSASAGALTAVVPAGATTGPIGVTVDGRTGTSATSFSVVASGAHLGSYPVGSRPSPPLSSIPYGTAVDRTGDVWVCHYGDGTVSRLAPNGDVKGTYACGAAPVAMAVDDSDMVWVANYTAGTVTRLSADGDLLTTTPTGANPVGIAFDGSGNAWVSNFGAGTLTQLSPTGAPRAEVAAGCLNPAGIAVDAGGVLWVVQHDMNQVARLAPDGQVLSSQAVGAQPSAIAFDPDGHLWVANYGSGDLTKLSAAGAALGTFLCNAAPRALAFDLTGTLWVANYSLSKITRLSAEGAILDTAIVGANPSGLAVDRSGALWVPSYGTGLVKKVAP